MRRTLVVLFLFACCGSAFAMAVFPPAPDSQTFVKIATQTPFCAVSRTDVAIEGSTITFDIWVENEVGARHTTGEAVVELAS